jgi:hypothetical protein
VATFQIPWVTQHRLDVKSGILGLYYAESCDVNLLYLPVFLMLNLLEMSPHTTGEDASRSFLFETYSAIATFEAAASQLSTPSMFHHF